MQLHEDLLRRARLIGELHPLKKQPRKHAVNLILVLLRREIHAPVILAVEHTGEEQHIGVALIALQLLEALLRQTAEADGDRLAFQHLVQVDVQPAEMLKLFDLLVELFKCGGQHGAPVCQRLHPGLQPVNVGIPVGKFLLVLCRSRQLAAQPVDKSLELGQPDGVEVFLPHRRIGGVVRIVFGHIVRLEHTAAPADVQHAVERICRTADGDQLHFGNSHTVPSF